MKYGMTSKSRIAGCGLMILIFIALPAVYVAGGAYTETFPRPFNSARWIAVRELQDNRRCGMLVDLRARIGLAGKTRDEIVKLLGEPDDIRSEPNVSRWLLCPSFMDVWVLAIRWENNRAIYAVVHDT